jgi:hypothetical protein
MEVNGLLIGHGRPNFFLLLTNGELGVKLGSVAEGSVAEGSVV